MPLQNWWDFKKLDSGCWLTGTGIRSMVNLIATASRRATCTGQMAVRRDSFGLKWISPSNMIFACCGLPPTYFSHISRKKIFFKYFWIMSDLESSIFTVLLLLDRNSVLHCCLNALSNLPPWCLCARVHLVLCFLLPGPQIPGTGPLLIPSLCHAWLVTSQKCHLDVLCLLPYLK